MLKAPSLETLIVTANRLLKFEFPVTRNTHVYGRLLKTHLQSSGLSKRLVEDLPLFLQERLYLALWQHTLQPTAAMEGHNRMLALLFLAEQLLEFRERELVAQDIALLGAQTQPGLHSYYYHGQMDRDTLLAILEKNHYQMTNTQQAPEDRLLSAYLTDRALSQPLPWAELLSRMSPAEARQYPRILRLWLIYQSLVADPTLDELINAYPIDALTTLSERLQYDWHAEARQSGRCRPVRILVLVEGETEKLLLPIFAKTMQVDFTELGVYLLPSGGKNQMDSLYQKFQPVLRAPVFIMLDQDAAGTAQALRPILRPGDEIQELAEGEFEDTYELSLILETVNRCYEPYPRLTEDSFKAMMMPGEDLSILANAPVGRVQELKHLWKILNLGAFDKTLFAAQLAESVQQGKRQPSLALQRLIRSILEVRERALAAPQ